MTSSLLPSTQVMWKACLACLQKNPQRGTEILFAALRFCGSYSLTAKEVLLLLDVCEIESGGALSLSQQSVVRSLTKQ